MFQFTTTTFINSDKYAFDESLARFAGDNTSGKEVFKINKNDLRIKKANLYTDAENHTGYLKRGCVGVADKATILIPLAADDTEATLYRLVIRIRLAMVDQDSYYANDLVFKGKPFYVEFKPGVTAQDVADLITKYELATIEKPVLKFSGSGQTLTIEGTTPTQRITECYIQTWNPEATDVIPGAKGGFETVETLNSKSFKSTVVTGHEEFGTYHQLVKDNHLPTCANLRWATNQADETPIPGALYNQYIVRECVKRGVMGGDAVGEVTRSLTTHVFWVLSGDVSNKFETEIAKIGVTFTEVDPHDATYRGTATHTTANSEADSAS